MKQLDAPLKKEYRFTAISLLLLVALLHIIVILCNLSIADEDIYRKLVTVYAFGGVLLVVYKICWAILRFRLKKFSFDNKD